MRTDEQTERPTRDSAAELLARIETFLTKTGMTANRFGVLAVNDGNIVPRLRAGRTITLANADRLRDFMKNYRVTK